MKKKTVKTKTLKPRPFKMHWGSGFIIEEARFRSQYHEPSVQLLEYESGELSLRFCYYRKGRFQRAPLMIDAKEIGRLRKAIRDMPKLHKILRQLAR